MKVVADALDLLQGEKNVRMGFLLPTITSIKEKLKMLKNDNNIKNCGSLIDGLLEAIANRYGTVEFYTYNNMK